MQNDNTTADSDPRRIDLRDVMAALRPDRDVVRDRIAEREAAKQRVRDSVGAYTSAQRERGAGA